MLCLLQRYNEIKGVSRIYELYLCHHGIPGMHWGVRRYQNADGSLTSAGKRRYEHNISKTDSKALSLLKKEDNALTKRHTKSISKLESKIDALDANGRYKKARKLEKQIDKDKEKIKKKYDKKREKSADKFLKNHFKSFNELPLNDLSTKFKYAGSAIESVLAKKKYHFYYDPSRGYIAKEINVNRR